MRVKKIEIIPLAEKKAERRGISQEWIKETIRFPAQVVEGYGGRKVAHRKYMVQNKEYLLRVIYEERKTAVILSRYKYSLYICDSRIKDYLEMV